MFTADKYQRMVEDYYRMIAGLERVISRIKEEVVYQARERNPAIIIWFILSARNFRT